MRYLYVLIIFLSPLLCCQASDGKAKETQPKVESSALQKTVKKKRFQQFSSTRFQPKVWSVNKVYDVLSREHKEWIILDIRTSGETKNGFIKGARLLDFYSATFRSEIAKMPRDKRYLVYCAGGVRSARAFKLMAKMKFKHVVDMGGGFQAWRVAGLPVFKP